MDKSQKVWEQNNQRGTQTISHESSLPVRSSSSAHNILSDVCSPTKQQGGSRPSAAGVWRTPLSQRPPPSTQPTRIDIPLTRAMTTQTGPQTTSMNQNLHHSDRHVYACPISASKKRPQSSFPRQQQQQQQRTAVREEASTPTKHVSFRDPPAQQRNPPKQGKDPEQGTDVWVGKKEAQAKLEEPKELCEVKLLEQEVQRLRIKEERTLEENVRLRRLSLEWQFQKRLQEIQKKGNDDEEEEEDEDPDTLLMIQQLEKQTQANRTHTLLSYCTKSQFVSPKLLLILVFFCLQMVRSSATHVNTDLKMTEMRSRPQTTESRATTGNRLAFNLIFPQERLPPKSQFLSGSTAGQRRSNHINNVAAKQ